MDDLTRLRARVGRTFGNAPAASAIARVRAIVGPGNMPATFEGALATRAMEKLKDPDADRPTPSELAALEMMIRMMRPAPKYDGGQLEPFAQQEFSNTFSDWTQFTKLLEPLKAAIGKLQLTQGDPAGTGFLVRDDVLVTNKHVLDFLSRGTRVLESSQSVVRFHAEFNPIEFENAVPVEEVIKVHETLDIALLRVNPPKRQVLTIASAAPGLEDHVAAVGHPFDDPVNNPLFTRTIFGDKWGVKRAAPGEVVSLSASSVGHDCSTLGGNSGSPLMSLKTAEVVGLHSGGGFLWRNDAVSCVDLKAFVDTHA